LSHGAIVARELGFPAVVNLEGATQAIRTGDTVDLDGQTGAVMVVARDVA
jgi:pyruvate,water dikinase